MERGWKIPLSLPITLPARRVYAQIIIIRRSREFQNWVGLPYYKGKRAAVIAVPELTINAVRGNQQGPRVSVRDIERNVDIAGVADGVGRSSCVAHKPYTLFLVFHYK